MKLSKFFVIGVNVCLVILSILMISSASSPAFILGNFYGILTTGNNIKGLGLIWIGSGFVLMLMGIFGIWSTLKESAFMMNLYTVILSLTLILQIVTGATANTLSGDLGFFVSNTINDLMVQYGHNHKYGSAMDVIQIEYKCCGHSAASDWLLLDKHFKRFTESGDEMKESVLAMHDEDDQDMITQRKVPNGNSFGKRSIPSSCCRGRMCENYYSRGCFGLIYNDIGGIVFMVKTIAMISSILQIFGILAAYVYGKTLRD